MNIRDTFPSPGTKAMPYEMVNLVVVPEAERPEATNQLLSSVEELPSYDMWMTTKTRLAEVVNYLTCQRVDFDMAEDEVEAGHCNKKMIEADDYYLRALDLLY